MIKIKYKLEAGDTFISVKGHANSAPYGQDIVCAGVSAIVQTAILGLKAVADAYPTFIEIKEIKNTENNKENREEE